MKATLAEFTVYLEVKRTGAANDARLLSALTAASTGIDDVCGRIIEVAGSSTARTFRPRVQQTNLLQIDDCTTITTVVENTTTLTAGTDYIADPLNGRDISGRVVPYDALLRYRNSWYWNDVLPTVTVTAAWGWLAIPEPVKQCCLSLGKAIVQDREMRGDVVGFDGEGAVRLRKSKTMMDLIAPYLSTRAIGMV